MVCLVSWFLYSSLFPVCLLFAKTHFLCMSFCLSSKNTSFLNLTWSRVSVLTRNVTNLVKNFLAKFKWSDRNLIKSDWTVVTSTELTPHQLLQRPQHMVSRWPGEGTPLPSLLPTPVALSAAGHQIVNLIGNAAQGSRYSAGCDERGAEMVLGSLQACVWTCSGKLQRTVTNMTSLATAHRHRWSMLSDTSSHGFYVTLKHLILIWSHHIKAIVDFISHRF